MLANAHIYMHTQIVLCPGINDGIHLEKSINNLASIHPWVETIAVVPVGLTKYRENLPQLRSFTPEEALDIVKSCTEWQKRFRRSFGTRLVFPSDEFYILAGVKFPSKSSYEEFSQYENGVGISRLFIDELKSVEKRLQKIDAIPGKFVMVTGTLASGIISEFAEILNQSGKITARVCTIVNKFFGETVTVAGLLTGEDVAAAIKETDEDEIILIPDIMLNDERFLDDMTISELIRITGRKIIPVPISPRKMINKLQRS
jgi:putative radical SAM enzyme (TIGR03279 family)